MTHASLMRRDAGGDPLPDLAETWAAPDPPSLTFRLRPVPRFHDGRPLASSDMRYTFAWILDHENRSPNGVLYRRVQRILARDLPVFPLWAGRNVLARDRRLTGFTISPDESYASVASMRIVPAPAPAAGLAAPR